MWYIQFVSDRIRAWTIIGIAIRSAYALGLHVRNEGPSATAVKRESLVRTWWSLYSLERTLSIITGRPSIIVGSYCSVPLPMPVSEDNNSEEIEAAYRMRKGSTTAPSAASPTFSVSSNSGFDLSSNVGIAEANSGSYFKAVVQLSIITQNILTSLYSAGTILRSSSGIQQDTMQLVQRLDQWVSVLPVEFNSQDPSNNQKMKFSRERMLLGFQFCSARILLTRPSLTPRRQPWKETNDACFARSMANMCVEAAKTFVASLPDELHTDLIYDQGPWWCIVHHLMQAISVFLLGLSYPSSNSHDSMTMVFYVEKALSWLQALQDPVADRAYHVAMKLFQGITRPYSGEGSNIWTPDVDLSVPIPVPAGGQQVGPDIVLDAFLPSHFGAMPPPAAISSIHTYAAYDAIAAGANFRPHTVAPVFNEAYYMAR